MFKNQWVFPHSIDKMYKNPGFLNIGRLKSEDLPNGIRLFPCPLSFVSCLLSKQASKQTSKRLRLQILGVEQEVEVTNPIGQLFKSTTKSMMDGWTRGSMDRWMDGWHDGDKEQEARYKGKETRKKEQGQRTTDSDKEEETRKNNDSVREVLTFQHSDVQKPFVFIHLRDRMCKNLLVFEHPMSKK